MWWFDRKLPFSFALVGFLAACGFTPVLAPGGSALDLQGRIATEEPDTRIEYALNRRLEERLGRPAAADLKLRTTLSIDEDPSAFTSDREITRYTLEGELKYRVEDTAGQLITSGSVETFVGYSATGSTVATLAAERDAEDRLATALADLLVARLTIALQ
ncbi:LPS assembly lipoprotein LptE [Aestuariibius insulae]|uniref:LPS assembly lipoprotein LptE n=1 Tax=Aestuariibius insulae TaxID=2058287 RepID=UPI00345F01AC